MANIGQKIKQTLKSRPLHLSFSLVMLSLSVLFVADFLGLRDDQRANVQNARALVSQSLAVQLSTLASTNELEFLSKTVEKFVDHNDDVLAASLEERTGVSLAAFGDISLLQRVGDKSTVTHVRVPILDKDREWGDVRVVFTPSRLWLQDLTWFLFITGVSVVAFWLFISKVLLQLDPSRAIPDRVDSAFNLFNEGVLILDNEQHIIMANAAAAELVDIDADKLVGRKLDDWPWQVDDDWQAPWATTLHSGLDIADKPMRLRLDDSKTRLFMVSCSLVGNAEESQHGVLVTLDDMTVIEKKNQELAKTLKELRVSQDAISAKNAELQILATRDPLTGLYNRRVLMENLEREFLKAKRENLKLSCIMVDIDHFKAINDNYGHSVGDDVIEAVAHALKTVSREYDTVGRYGGEEFLMLLPGLPAKAALEVAERIRSSVVELATREHIAVDQLTASLGVSEIGFSAEDGPAMVDQADQALYVAKQAGRNRASIFDPNVVPISEPETQSIIKLVENFDDSALVRVKELEALVEQRNSDLDKLRQYDELTGVPTRSLFKQQIENELVRSKRLETSTGVMSFELRDMSLLLSTFGHATIDALVCEFVSRLHEGLRSTDLVVDISGEHSLSRLTNNEYGVLLSDMADASNAMPVITRLRRLLSEPFMVGQERVYVGANIGIALYPANGDTAELLMESAGRVRCEAAMSPEKVAHCFASDSLDQVSRSYIRLEADLHEALERNELSLHYQPKFDLAERKISGLEALLRWNHSDGYISPVDFVPVAEANGLIGAMFEFTLESSLRQIRKWRELGFDDLRVSVNISPVQLRDPNLVKTILDAVELAQVDTKALEIELTETAVIDNRESAIETLSSLRQAGIKVSMDDFGTGYTSLALLADLPLDIVKIDRSFAVAMADSARSRAIVESVINMAHALQLRVVGEGVETNDQLVTLSTLGCNEIQGFLIAKPLPADQATSFLISQSEVDRRRRA